MVKGWIALDIDGTLTEGSAPIAKQTESYLHSLYQEGWKILFVTGRTFSFAHKTLFSLSFPYTIALQQGADLVEMPGRKVIEQKYISGEVIGHIEEAYRGEKEDFLIYGGFLQGDFCYYRKERFSPFVLSYLDKIMPLSNESWRSVADFEALKKLSFPLIKCFGPKETMLRIEKKLQATIEAEIVVIGDPLHPKHYLILITSKEATKGRAIDRVIALQGTPGKVIAAGDDYNDLSMFERADVRIVMETAPQEIKQYADIVAKGVQEEEIIAALQQAILEV